MRESDVHTYVFERFRVDASKRLLFDNDGKLIEVTPKVFDTLMYFIKNAGRLIEKDELMSGVWKDSIVEENNLNKNVSVLRRIFGEKRNDHRFIVTIPGRGYQFVARVTTTDEPNESDSALAPEAGGDSDVDTLSPGNDQVEPNQLTEKERDSRLRRVFKGIPFKYQVMLGSLIVLIPASAIILNHNVTSGPEPRIRSVAVLPFRPVTQGNQNELLQLGTADALISKLGGVEELAVRPLSAVRRYQSLEQDSLIAGRELGVEAVLDGGFQQSGDRIRITARLLRVQDGKQIWSGQFDEDLRNIFAVQDSISERVASALRVRLVDTEKKRFTDNIKAYQLYLKGRSLTTPPDTPRAIEYFVQAIEIDSDYALAYAGLAAAYRTLVLAGDQNPVEMMSRARKAANRAVEIDDKLAEAYVALGTVELFYEWNWTKSEELFLHALALDPNSADARFFYAHLLSNLGRHKEALEQHKKALELDPLEPRFNALEGQFLVYAGKSAEAVDRLKSSMELHPDFWLQHLCLSRAFIDLGLNEQAIEEARKAKELSSGNTEAISFVAYALAKSGRKDEARKVLLDLKQREKTQYVPPLNIALVHNSLGESDEALELLEKGLEIRDVRMAFLKVDAKWDNLRSHPRFIKLMHKLKLN